MKAKTREVKKGHRVRVVKPIPGLTVSAVGVEGFVYEIKDGIASVRQNGGTWYAVEVEHLKII